VNKPIDIARAEHETPSELKWIFAQRVLAMPCRLCPLARNGIIFAKQMEQGSAAHPRRPVSLPMLVDQQGKAYAGVFAEYFGVAHIAQPNGCNARAFRQKFCLVVTQLRDMLAAKYSAVMPKKCDHRRTRGPERSQLNRVALRVRQHDGGQAAADSFTHFPILERRDPEGQF
jgi:hypothetical protein